MNEVAQWIMLVGLTVVILLMLYSNGKLIETVSRLADSVKALTRSVNRGNGYHDV